MSKHAVEEIYHLNIGKYKEYFEAGTGVRGQISFGECTYSIKIVPALMRIIINGVQLNVSETPCNYGGVRYWFDCPNCHNRISKLYIYNKRFQCRKCADLNYYSQQRTKTDCGYFLYLAEKLAKKVQSDFKVDPVYAHFPMKPKWMKWHKYCKMERQFWNYLSKRDELWMSSVSRLMGRG